MTRLDRLAIVFTIVALIAVVFGQHPRFVDDPNIGRRPISAAPPAQLEPGAPRVLEPVPERVRRPLPSPTPGDPLFSVNVGAIPPHATALGTSFSVGRGIWLTARHVANSGCRQIVMVVDKAPTPVEIKYLHPDADLALLQTPSRAAPALPVATADMIAGESGFSFGFPHGSLGAFEGTLLGRSRMQLEGHLEGTAPVLTWAEQRRFPETLESLQGMSGGPMLDDNGKVVGIMVAASVRRGRTFTVAPEIVRAAAQQFALNAATPRQASAREVETRPVSLGDAATALSGNSRIVETFCTPS